MTTIYAGSKVLARDGDELPEATRREIFSDIAVESERLHRLVEDVIAMTRFQEDEGDVGTEPVLVQRILPAVIRSEKARWPGVTFELDLRPGVPTAVADPTYVEQVIRNLLSNAAKYGGPGTTVTIAVTSTDDEVIVTVTDDGPGFPPDEADRVFELFFRSQGTAAAAARRRHRAVRLRPADPGDGRADLGSGRRETAAPSSGSRCGSWATRPDRLRSSGASGRPRRSRARTRSSTRRRGSSCSGCRRTAP